MTLSSIALIGVPAATADEQQATAEQNTAAKPSVIINEVYAGNTKAAGDPDSKRCDWVELKNCTYFDIADGARNWCKANNYGPNDCMSIDLQ
ncbi:lamin tail domain-containing protein [Bifidobacterium longum]|uniref:lamin tail domain-containing protein n=1 Tax=Bifidobacterium longum TaxID=216816 RepID=UPI0020743ADF|nr:lamin tail domain-containing protein [Bifidobacterium longum]MDW3105214.1 lamin tail domain-containing protein [Bifidobacterium longum]